MVSGTKVTRVEGASNLTSAVIEAAALEIIQNANDVLEMYGIDGAVVNLGLGLITVQKKTKSVEDLEYELEFVESKDFAFAVNYKHPDFKKL